MILFNSTLTVRRLDSVAFFIGSRDICAQTRKLS